MIHSSIKLAVMENDVDVIVYLWIGCTKTHEAAKSRTHTYSLSWK